MSKDTTVDEHSRVGGFDPKAIRSFVTPYSYIIIPAHNPMHRRAMVHHAPTEQRDEDQTPSYL